MFLVRLLVKNAFRHKLRTALTILGMTIAILAFGLLRTVISAWYAGVEASSASRLIVRNAISLVFFLPISYKEKIRQVEGVESVAQANWFGGIYIEEKNFFANFAAEPETYLELFPEFVLPPEQKNAFLHDRKGAVAGRKLAEKFGWEIGDPITLKGTIFPGNWDFTLRGIYTGRDKSVDEAQFFFHWEYLNETMKKTIPRRADQAGFFIVGLKNPNLAAEVSAAIDAQFKNSLAETLTETEKAFQLGFISMTEAIVVVIRLVSFIIIVIIMAVVANTMAMTARERIGEYAILKALGFGAPYLATLIFGESLFITSLGAALGIAATFPAAKAFGNALGQFFPVFNVAPGTVYLDIAASVVVGLVAAVVPTLRAVRIRIADGLRRIG
ncbi:MAG: ABC transporter permease [Alphaproteobacteria bacterium]|uniref:ABC transporter permease n=1 Tax=Candidatus Nitrobium versatile TaxID=2884831 RepID=A0A953JCB6_9BACT|nr:ABC transporter permease [Candidatus Nitrobium versatile]